MDTDLITLQPYLWYVYKIFLSQVKTVSAMDLILVKPMKKFYVNTTFVVKTLETYESKFQIMIPTVTVTAIQHT